MNSVEEILESMGMILEENEGSSDWSKRLKNLARNKTLHKDDYHYAVKRLYGGMGSLNDVVVMDGRGGYPREANQKFDSLRDDLKVALENFLKE
jgi:hypothetical protein|tara:strand:- start:130 stop:411 length:282 start_codon:yes stop_codon:yes gene_type:complete